MSAAPMPVPTQERLPKPKGKIIKEKERFTSQEVQEINEIRVEQRNLYYQYRFWVVGGIPWALFIGILALLNVDEFAGPRRDYPIYFYITLVLIGVLIVWGTIALHKYAFDDEDTYLWSKVNDIAKEKHKKFNSMKSDEFGELMKAVGMRGGKDD